MVDNPCETKNLAYYPACSEVLSDLKEKIKRFQKITNDSWISKWEHE